MLDVADRVIELRDGELLGAPAARLSAVPSAARPTRRSAA